MRMTIFCLTMLLAATQATAQTTEYQQCTQLVQRAPDKALSTAEDWIQRANHPSGYHCRALALFALKRYPEAAKALETLSFVITESNPVLWGNVIRQAAKSWGLAGENAKAIVVLTKGIEKTSTDGLENPVLGQLGAEMLLDRSRFYLFGGRELFALQDLDQALTLAPNSPKLLLARAELFAIQKEMALAKRDIEAIEKINPNYPGISRIKSRLQ